MASSGRVRVLVRARPTLPREVQDGAVVTCIGVDSAAGKVYLHRGEGNVIVDDGVADTATATTSGPLPEFRFHKALRGDCTEHDVYDGAVESAVQSFRSGYNTTIFAYGQSGSGKTHTITHLTKFILKDICEDDDADLSISVFQIYQEVLTDLTQQGTPKVVLKGNGDGVVVEGAEQVEFSSAKGASDVIRKAMTRRAVGATDLNDVSSRSHLIIQICCNGAKLNLVDLAGSERVKQSNASGLRLDEAKAINSSLFALINVVRSLAEPSRQSQIIPYRDSKLTYLLKDSLGGDCVTVLIATISPSQESSSETHGTLKFATACGAIVNTPLRREPPKKEKKAPPPPKLIAPWKGVVTKTSRSTVSTKSGKVSLLHPSNPRKDESVIFLLHGCPSEGASFIEWFPVLQYCGLFPVAIDMPGFGESSGEPHRSRSEYNLDAGGPVEVLLCVMKSLSVKTAHLMGYDWGAGIALSAALAHPLRFKSVISIMPSFAEQKPAELSRLRPTTLILWVETDQFHPWKKWRSLAKSIPGGTVYTTKKNGGFVTSFASEVCKFVTGSSPLERTAEVGSAQVTKGKTTKGEDIKVVNRVILKTDVGSTVATEMAKQNSADGATADVTAVSAFTSWYTSLSSSEVSDIFKHCALTATPSSRTALKLFSSLPTLSPESVGDGTALCALGIWTAPANRDVLEASPRYFPGRSVLAPVSSLCVDHSKRNYMKVIKGGNRKAYVTHHARIRSVLPEVYQIEVEADNGVVVVEVAHRAVHLLNQPHIFAQKNGKYLFEDGLRGAYESSVVRGKLFEIALLLAPTIAKIDFASDTCSTQQRKCITIIRNALNCTTFAGGVDRDRIGRTDDIGRLACFGQVQCHGGSSLLAFFLLPFATALGLDLKYRGGYTFGPGHDGGTEISDTVEAHQWLEVTLRPSCESVVADFFLNMIAVPTSDAYQNMMYPNGRHIIQTTAAPLCDTDVGSMEF